MHFGRFLRSSYEPRGFTQKTLAESASVTLGTIARAVACETCPWRRSVSMRVMEALHARSPLTAEEQDQYTKLTGLTALTRVADAYDRIKADERMASIAARGAEQANQSQLSPEEQTAHTWVMRLMQETGDLRVLAALEGLAAAWNIDLPPRIRAEDLNTRHPRWILTNTFIDKPSGMQITEYTPIDPAQVGKPIASQKAKPIIDATQRSKKGRTG